MTFLPIVERELRVASRRRSTYWVRAAAALGAIIVGCFVFAGSYEEASHQFGTHLFFAISYLAMFYSLTAGIRATADCLSEEKREGTLGLLFLTDLKGYDVVLGKLVATSLNAFYGLISIFPILAVPLLLGGIKGAELARMALVLLNTFAFSLAVGMLVSSISQSPRKAVGGTLTLLLLITGGLPFCAVWLLSRAGDHRWAENLFLGSPFFAFNEVPDSEFIRGAARFWWSSGLLHAATWLSLGFACFIVPRSWQDRPAGAKGQRWRDIWQAWSYGDEVERRSFRRALLDENAFYWMASRARLKTLHVWGFLGVIACIWAWGCLEFRGDWFNVGVYLMTALVMNGVLKYWIASEAGRRIGEDRKAGALELLLSTPFSVAEILHGQMLALRRQFMWPLFTVLALEIAFLVVTITSEASEPSLTGMWVAGLAMLVIDVITLPWVAMWVALSTRNPNRATGITAVRVLILPWVLFVGITMVLGITTNGTALDSWKILVGLWVGLGVLTDIVLGTSAHQQLRSNFRALAMERFMQKPARSAKAAATIRPTGQTASDPVG